METARGLPAKLDASSHDYAGHDREPKKRHGDDYDDACVVPSAKQLNEVAKLIAEEPQEPAEQRSAHRSGIRGLACDRGHGVVDLLRSPTVGHCLGHGERHRSERDVRRAGRRLSVLADEILQVKPFPANA